MADLAEHQRYLQDQHRFDAYESALATLSPGRTVLDLGAGTGLLGLTALRHGARRVYAVEGTALADWTGAVAERNAHADRYVVLRGSSRRIDLPERVDVVVCDQLGGFICEGMPLPVLADAASRHLKPGGHLIPATVEFAVQPLRSSAISRQLDFWSTPRFELDVSPLRDAAIGTPLYEHSPPAELAGPPASLGVLDTSRQADAVDLRTTVRVEGDGPINALAAYFTAELAPGVTITTRPDDPLRIDRENVVLPLDPPLESARGDEFAVRVRASLHSGVLSWTVTGPGGRRRKHSTWQGFTGMSIPRD